MTDKSPLKKRLNNAEEEELESGKKRQKVSNEEAKKKPVVADSSEGSFDGSENDEDDSFDDDFDQDEGEESDKEGSIDIFHIRLLNQPYLVLILLKWIFLCAALILHASDAKWLRPPFLFHALFENGTNRLFTSVNKFLYCSVAARFVAKTPLLMGVGRFTPSLNLIYMAPWVHIEYSIPK